MNIFLLCKPKQKTPLENPGLLKQEKNEWYLVSSNKKFKKIGSKKTATFFSMNRQLNMKALTYNIFFHSISTRTVF